MSKTIKITVDEHGLTYSTDGFSSLAEAIGAIESCAHIMIREAYPPVLPTKEPFVRVQP